jgi:hypothetical protein
MSLNLFSAPSPLSSVLILLPVAAIRDTGASRFAILVITALDGLSPLLAGMMVLLPFIFSNLWGDITYSYVAGLGMALLELFWAGRLFGHGGAGEYHARRGTDDPGRRGLCRYHPGIELSIAS